MDSIPVGLCQCGCGKPTRIATETLKCRNQVKGHPTRYLRGHSGGRPRKADFCISAGAPITGTCGCGCGGKTPLAHITIQRRGIVKGQPLRYLKGHHTRKSPVNYVEEDRGYSTPCHIWQLTITPKGYGLAYDPETGRMRGAHRLAWERENGPVPPDKELDHKCKQRPCIRLDHLRTVTHAENVRYSYQPLMEVGNQ